MTTKSVAVRNPSNMVPRRALKVFFALHLCMVESSPIRYPVTTGALGRPRRFGCLWRSRCCLFPGGFRQKATQSCQTGAIRNLPQQAREGSCSLTEHQSQQHGHEVLILGFGEHLPKPFCKVADIFIQAYNGDRHWTPPWPQGWLFLPLIPHGVLSCYLPFKKCKHRELINTAILT